MQEKYSDMICDFLRSHNLISVNALEEKLNIPQSTIGKAMNENRLIPTKHIFPIICELSRYGFEIDGYSLSLDEATGVLFGRKFVENIETIEEPQGSFEYIIKEYRNIYSDFFDLL